MSFLLPNIPPSILHSHTVRSQNALLPPSLISIEALQSRPKPKPPAELQEIKSSKDNKGESRREKDEFYLNLGIAVRTLRDDLPALFYRDLDYSIYRNDITFVDPLNTFQGIEDYKLIFWALRFHGRVLFKEIGVEILRVWQPSETMILIRWELQGIPRVPWEARGRFQGTSRYKLDKNGKIYEHKVDNLAFNFPRVVKPARVLDLVAAAASPNMSLQWDLIEDDTIGASSWLKLYREVHSTLLREKEVQGLAGLGVMTCL